MKRHKVLQWLLQHSLQHSPKMAFLGCFGAFLGVLHCCSEFLGDRYTPPPYAIFTHLSDGPSGNRPAALVDTMTDLETARQEWEAVTAALRNPRIGLLESRRLFRRLWEISATIAKLEKDTQS